jgi:ribosome-associated heat shock protein Hsp15
MGRGTETVISLYLNYAIPLKKQILFFRAIPSMPENSLLSLCCNMTTEKSVRLDSYLWAIRMFKSRSLASEAIKNNKVKLNDEVVKAAHTVKIGERYTISYPQNIKKIIEVTGIIDKRQSFAIAKEHYIDHSPPVEKTEKLGSVFFMPNMLRDRGAGRPTKKDKRDMDRFRKD